jgi:hypothetical protein
MANPKIFLNYRSDDSPGLVKIFYKCLKKRFGDEFFFDQSKINTGDEFGKVIEQSIKDCKLFYIFIGQNWDSADHIETRKDKQDWVFFEIELAIHYGKKIIPIYIGRNPKYKPIQLDRFPDHIKSTVLKIQKLDSSELSSEDDFWEDEVKRFDKEIQSLTGLLPNLPIEIYFDDKQYLQNICLLDRTKPHGMLYSDKQNGRVLFSASGSEDSGFDTFAERCRLKLLDGAEIKNLDWDEFRDIPTSELRRRKLYEQIAGALGISTKEFDHNELISQLQTRFSGDHKQAYVFTCMRWDGIETGHGKGPICDWWHVWQTLIGEAKNPNLLVLLYTVPGWLQRLILFRPKAKETVFRYIGRFNRISYADIKYWKRTCKDYLQQFDTATMDKEINKIFMFPFIKKKFEHVNERIRNALMKAHHPHQGI